MQQAHWSWSHSLKNYLLMFDLTSADFCQPILDVAAGASSFNFEMTGQGYNVISCDPLYATPPDKIAEIVNQLTTNLTTHIKSHLDEYQLGAEYTDVDDIERQQRAMAEIFVRDFPQGLKENRYVAEALPKLSFTNYQFCFALCANFIFDGSHANDVEFQLQSIKEMARVAREVRIFPLLDPTGNISTALGPILAQLQIEGYGVEIRQVHYQLLKKGNAMLRVFAKNCPL